MNTNLVVSIQKAIIPLLLSNNKEWHQDENGVCHNSFGNEKLYSKVTYPWPSDKHMEAIELTDALIKIMCDEGKLQRFDSYPVTRSSVMAFYACLLMGDEDTLIGKVSNSEGAWKLLIALHVAYAMNGSKIPDGVFYSWSSLCASAAA